MLVGFRAALLIALFIRETYPIGQHLE